MGEKLHYVIGDIHGCLTEYKLLEAKIYKQAKKNNATPIIISCGDLIDRGPQSKEVIDHFIQGQKNNTHFAVMGNHEMLLLATVLLNKPDELKKLNLPYWFENIFPGATKELSTELKSELNEEMITWIPQGGASTLKSYGAMDVFDPQTWEIPQEHLQFYLDLPFYIEKDHFFVSHALPLRDYIPEIEKLQSGDSTEVEKKYLNHFIWNRNPKETKPIKNKINISGHTPMHGIKRSKGKKVLQIDTACYQGGALTAYCVEKDSFLKVKFKGEV